jgi:hypothetical protein
LGFRRKRPVLRSSFEDKVVAELRNSKVEFEYESMKVSYTQIHTYTPDLIFPNGVIVELKGYFDATDRGKHKRIKLSNPSLDIRFVFQKADKKISKTSKTTYAMWAEKNGFMWAEGSIPKEWLK